MSESSDDQIVADLARSGLVVDDMRVRPMDATAREACNINNKNVSGYMIPYNSIKGTPIPFYRVRLFDYEPKYKQVRDTPNHVYFPPNFLSCFRKVQGKYIIITEGEKKAALASKLGLPCAAFGGVDSWRNRTIVLPKDTQFSALSYNKGLIGAKLPSTNFDVEEATMTPLAVGFQDLIDLGLQFKSRIIIIYDTEATMHVGAAVQRAAAKLGYELRFKGFGVDQIKQLILPALSKDGIVTEKTSLDDYLLSAGGVESFMSLLQKVYHGPRAFPRYPNLRDYIGRQLQKQKMDRKAMTQLSLSIVTELDARGRRMYSAEEGQMYYFDETSGILMPVDINTQAKELQQEGPFGKLLYKEFGISTAGDARLIQWLGSQFAGEDPIEHVVPNRILAKPTLDEDAVRYQLSDGQYVKVTGDLEEPYRICVNGTEGYLFEAGRVKPIDGDVFAHAWKQVTDRPISNWWRQTLAQTRLKDQGKHAQLLSYLFYISPWLNRWRGTQLPVELASGEPGSGKSTLYELRLDILAGEASLRNPPTDLRDWQASVVNTGGLHVTDNVQLVDKALKQRLSDEICRLITEPNPHIEMRKLYSNADLMRVKVDAVFAITAVTQPFMNSDLIQRAIMLEFDKHLAAANAGGLSYDSFWKHHQITNRGGRVFWLAHHLHAIHEFFKLVKKEWDPHYKAKYRLINVEQALMLMSKVFNEDGSWIPAHLAGSTNEAIGKADWTLEGIQAFREYWLSTDNRNKKFIVKVISDWCAENDDFKDCQQLVNSRALGRYIANNKHLVESIGGVKEEDNYGNRQRYSAVRPQNNS